MKKVLLIAGAGIGSLIIIFGVTFGAFKLYDNMNKTEPYETISHENEGDGKFTVETEDMAEYDDYFDYEFDVMNLLDDIESSMWYLGDLDEEIEFDEDTIFDEFWQEEVTEELEYIRETAESVQDIEEPERFEEFQGEVNEAMDSMISMTNNYPEAIESQNDDDLTQLSKNVVKAEDLVNKAIEKEEQRNPEVFNDYYYYEFAPY